MLASRWSECSSRGILDISEDDFAEVARSAKRIATAAIKAIKADGVIIQQFSKPASGQVVFQIILLEILSSTYDPPPLP